MTIDNATNDFPPVSMMDIEGMEPAARRVLIAQDALALLAANQLTPTTGIYVDTDMRALPPETPAHELFNALPTGCGACALGFMLVATVRRFNKVCLGDLGDFGNLVDIGPERTPLVDYLKTFFEAEQLDLMECVFEAYISKEGTRRYHHELLGHEWYQGDSDAHVMRAIFQNIVDNNGEFVIPDLEPDDELANDDDDDDEELEDEEDLNEDEEEELE